MGCLQSRKPEDIMEIDQQREQIQQTRNSQVIEIVSVDVSEQSEIMNPDRRVTLEECRESLVKAKEEMSKLNEQLQVFDSDQEDSQQQILDF